MFGKIFKRRSEDISAASLYTKCLRQARLPAFFGPGRIEDNYDGRIDLLTLHMTIVMTAGRQFGDDGAQLNQALYDVMVQDFNIAMREEGLADTGIARRIKPMVMLFLERTKSYTEALEGGAPLRDVFAANTVGEYGEAAFVEALADYAERAYVQVRALDFNGLKSGQVSFAPFTYS